jgi:hypothetical protein
MDMAIYGHLQLLIWLDQCSWSNVQNSMIGEICEIDWDSKHLPQAPSHLGGCLREHTIQISDF